MKTTCQKGLKPRILPIYYGNFNFGIYFWNHGRKLPKCMYLQAAGGEIHCDSPVALSQVQ